MVSTPTRNQVSNDTPQHQCTLPVFLCAFAPTMILRVHDRVRDSSPFLKRSHLTFNRREIGWIYKSFLSKGHGTLRASSRTTSTNLSAL